MIIVTGPTGIGKTDYALALAAHVSGEIVNVDVGQCYTPLTIGTAKPNLPTQVITHHLFDWIDFPVSCTVVDFLARVRVCVQEIYARGNIPILVGGSSFYVYSLFFPPKGAGAVEKRLYTQSNEELWRELYSVDPERASQVPVSDRYRMMRALDIWYARATKPSVLKPCFDPIHEPVILLVMNRDRQELYARIDERVKSMLAAGWIEEVAVLDQVWHDFLLQKKLIGYDDIVRFMRDGTKNREKDFTQLAALIAQKTRAYAKRQTTFNRLIIKKVEEHADCVYTELVSGIYDNHVGDRVLSMLETLKESMHDSE